jgi:hypothetical protein
VSLTEMSKPPGDSSCCSTVPLARVARMSPGSRRMGILLIVASAAPVTRLVAPGPTEVVQANVCKRFRIREKPTAVCTMACSLRHW